MKNKSLLFLTIPVFLLGVFLGSFGYKYLFKSKVKTVNSDPKVNTSPTPEITKNDIQINDKQINVLLLGHGGEGHSGGTLMDSIILLNIDTEGKKATLISIPRDLYFNSHKINEEYSVVGGNDGWNRIKNATAGVTGLTVNNFVAVDFSGFIKLIDAVGGVDVDTKKAYVDNFYPVKGKENETCGKSAEEIAKLHSQYSGFELEKQFICRYEKIEYGVGLNHLNGNSALKYVRSRHGDGDFGRSRRQFEVLTALVKKYNFSLLDEILKLVDTDLNKENINKILKLVDNPLEYEINSIHLTDENVLVSSKSPSGAYILIPKDGINNFQGVRNYLQGKE